MTPAVPFSLSSGARGASEASSRAIGIARVLCITGIVYVHAWTGLASGPLAAADGTAQGALRWGLIELLGRSAVPLLGMISGWLVAGSVMRRSYRDFVAGKARTILVPMLLWNAIAILLVGSAAAAGVLMAPQPTSLGWVIDELTCLTRPADINVQMSFLRDLFLCMAAAPLLARLPSPALVAVALLALLWSVSGFAFPLLLRPAILLFFVVGMLARRGGTAGWIAALPLGVAVLPYGLLAATKILLEMRGWGNAAGHDLALSAIDHGFRLATAIAFWSIASRLAETRLGSVILRVEPYAFLMFCSHLIMIWFGGPMIGQFVGRLGAPLYPGFLLVQPLLVIAAAIGLGRALLALSPPAATLLSGGRLGRAERPLTPKMVEAVCG